MNTRRTAPLILFERHFVKGPAKDCWPWLASLNHGGYGVFGGAPGRPTRNAHTAAYVFYVGPVPAGLEVDHVCGVRRCVNPAHLRVVTHSENLRAHVEAFDPAFSSTQVAFRGNLRSQIESEAERCGRSFSSMARVLVQRGLATLQKASAA